MTRSAGAILDSLRLPALVRARDPVAIRDVVDRYLEGSELGERFRDIDD